MGARVRSISRIALIAAALAGTGCGSAFKLPTEQTANRVAPADKQYQMIATWTGLTGVTDVLLIPGPQLFFAFKGRPGVAGRVFEFSTTLPQPLAVDRFQGLLHPAALAANAASVFVLDQGDTSAARSANPDSNNYQLDCGPMKGKFNVIVDLSKYWYAREYDIKGRSLKTLFTDTTFAWVSGIAADDQGRVYVSGVIMHCFVDQYDVRNRTLDNEFRIYRYARGIDDRYVLGAVGAAPVQRGVWGRDPSFEVVEGTGIGSTHDPRGMQWSAATGSALFFADFGNNEAQKFDLQGSLANSFKLDVCDEDTTQLVDPTDITVDDNGFVYVVDAGNRRVLRYEKDGSRCAQRVDLESATSEHPLIGPVAAASLDFDGTNYVYVVDAAGNQVGVYRRRQ